MTRGQTGHKARQGTWPWNTCVADVRRRLFRIDREFLQWSRVENTRRSA